LTLVYENGLWGTSVAHAQRRQAWRLGYSIALEVPYVAGAGNYISELERISSKMPAIVLQASYDRDAVALVDGYSRLPVPPVAVLGMDSGFISPQFIPSLGERAEHIFSREVWALDLGEKKPLIKNVNDLFYTKFQHNMTGNSARSFTGLIVLSDAINRSDNPTPKNIREALIQTDLEADQLIMPWDGIRFDPETGQNILGKGIIVQVQNSHYVTVWPEQLSVRPPIWPNGMSYMGK
jgi:branched-chain amino acid transport system substrate-binding protein